MFIPLSDKYKSAPPRVREGSCRLGFTLLETLVAMAVFLVLMGLLFSMIGQSSSILQRTQNDVSSFQSARFAFNLVTRTLSQSRMGVYDDYDSTSNPTTYIRDSNLNFVVAAPPKSDFGQGNAVFFQAPLGRVGNTGTFGGMPGLLNSVGYYVTYGTNPSLPAFLQKYDRNRFRLMQFLAPAEQMLTYTTNDSGWYTGLLDSYSTVIADNVILLLCWPRLSKDEDSEGGELTTDYHYDSRDSSKGVNHPTFNQQPPMVQVTFVVIDKVNADRLPNTAAVPSAISDALSGLFTTSTEEKYQEDLAKLEDRLNQKRIGHQIFNSTVPLRETKWTK